jgi:hypothetical protein
MSVSPDNPLHLPRHRRPPELGGTGKDPVWCINADELGPDLRYVPDSAHPAAHGFIEPARPMPLRQYKRALEATGSVWRRVVP